MDKENILTTVYVNQTSEITNSIIAGKTHFAKMRFIKSKYAEAAAPFLYIYEWYLENAKKIVAPPEEAESGIWGYTDLKFIEKHVGTEILELAVPIENIVFFSLDDWNKIQNLTLLGKDGAEQSKFENEISKAGIMFSSDILLTGFYPMFKSKVLKSWQNLFRYDAKIKAGEAVEAADIGIGLWEIKPEWVVQKLK